MTSYSSLSEETVHDRRTESGAKGCVRLFSKVRRTCLGSFGNPVQPTECFAAEARCRGLVAFASTTAQAAWASSAARGWKSTANCGISARRVGDELRPRECLDGSAIEFRDTPVDLGRPSGFGILVDFGFKAVKQRTC